MEDGWMWKDRRVRRNRINDEEEAESRQNDHKIHFLSDSLSNRLKLLFYMWCSDSISDVSAESFLEFHLVVCRFRGESERKENERKHEDKTLKHLVLVTVRSSSAVWNRHVTPAAARTTDTFMFLCDESYVPFQHERRRSCRPEGGASVPTFVSVTEPEPEHDVSIKPYLQRRHKMKSLP